MRLPPGVRTARRPTPISAQEQGLPSTEVHTNFLPAGKKSPDCPAAGVTRRAFA